jgi:hypothetical protein
MLVVISPAKKLDMEPMPGVTPSVPDFATDTASLVRTARNLPIKALEQLMDISRPLAKLNAERFRDFDAQDQKPAAMAFAGDTYQGLEAATLDADELAWAQDHLRILSGLYGLLRPLDAIRPYRLEMGSRLKTRRGKSLYDFWGAKIAKALNAQAEAIGADVLVNCASQEYFGAVDRKALKLRVITPVFLEERNGQAKTVSFFAKKARGAMARFIVQNRLVDPEVIKEFESGGYRWCPEMTSGDTWVFRRPYPEAAASGGI